MNRSTVKYEKVHRRRRIWYRIVSFLSAITVFVTTYALILPAITMEPSPGILMDNVFVYEDGEVYMSFLVQGRAGFANEDEAVDGAVSDNVNMYVERLTQNSIVYSEYYKYAESEIGEESIYDLLVYDLSFTYGAEGVKLNTDLCTVTCEIIAKEDLVNAGITAISNKRVLSETMRAFATPFALASIEPEPTPEPDEETLTMTSIQGIGGETALTFLEDGESVMTMTIPISGSSVALATSSSVNPLFTVQYYVNTTQLSDDTTTNKTLAVINNDSGQTPKNGTAPSMMDIALSKIDDTWYKIATEQICKPLYNSDSHYFLNVRDLAHIDLNYQNPNYTIEGIYVLTGTDPSSMSSADWKRYDSDVSFTNNPNMATDKRIYVTNDTVIRIIYDETTEYYNRPADFYDYDITDGYIYSTGSTSTKTATSKQTNTKTWYVKTSNYGINSFTAASGTQKYAFGNNNTGTNFGTLTWTDPATNTTNQPNKFNTTNNNGANGCTFGLVTAIGSDGNPVFASGLSAPNLFGSGNVTGRTAVNDWTLQFTRTGDTYVLTQVLNASGNGIFEAENRTLDMFFSPVNDADATTNNFWPMDYSSTWGADGHDFKFGNQSLKNYRQYQPGGTWLTMPYSDDGQDHNSYFGMTYTVDFELSKEYAGDLSYLFFGDDDMWVFLDGHLVCDIGGVHSSVGMYVDLWEYINKEELYPGDSEYGKHTLTFFYTERGASGSTCYMEFTLPSVDYQHPQEENVDLELEKQVIGATTDQKFTFDIEFKNIDGTPIVNDYEVILSDADGMELEYLIMSEGKLQVQLAHGHDIVIKGLPKNQMSYTITEVEPPGYHVTHLINDEPSQEGNIVSIAALEVNTKVTFVNTTSMLLPSTGGTGILPYLIPLMMALLMIPAIPIGDRMIKRKRSKNRTPQV